MSDSYSEKKSQLDEILAIDPNALPLGVDGEIGIALRETSGLKRGLKQRHIQMIALAGAIGTGLFLGSGRALATAGPMSIFLGYLLTGIFVATAVLSLAEMSALVPLSGSIIRHAEFFFDPALSFAIGWNQVYVQCVGLPAELTAAVVLLHFWTGNDNNDAAYIVVMGLLLLVSNLFFIRWYGELEFFFAMLKIMLIVGIIIMGLVIDLGGVDGHRRGFEYWRYWKVQYLDIPGAWGRFLGFWTVFGNAVYAYAGIENIATAAAETQNPRQNIPKAARRIFWRILIFYVISILIVTMIVPWYDENLLQSTGTAAQSPFVIVARRAGIRVVPHIINAVVLTSAWSSGNSGMMNGSRVLYGLARQRHAPRFLLRLNRFGVPYLAIIFLGLFLCLSFMSLQSTAQTVFSWFQSLVSSAALVLWIVICMVYLRFYYACKKQGIDRSELPWRSPFQPYSAWAGAIAFSVMLLTGGFSVFIDGQWDTQTFISKYFNIPLIFILYFGWKWIKKTKMVSLDEMPIRTFLDIAREAPEEPEKPAKGWRRLNILWS